MYVSPKNRKIACSCYSCAEFYRVISLLMIPFIGNLRGLAVQRITDFFLLLCRGFLILLKGSYDHAVNGGSIQKSEVYG